MLRAFARASPSTIGRRSSWIESGVRRASCCVAGGKQRSQESHDRHRDASWSDLAKGLTLAGFGLAAASVSKSSVAECSEGTHAEVNLLTYNVLSPPLARASAFPTCKPEDLDPDTRLRRILDRLDVAVAQETVIALQEVDLTWAGKLHTYFAQRGYCVVFGQYGKSFNGYMGVMVAWPSHLYEAKDVEICRLSDTAEKKMWPKPKPGAPSHYGMFSKHELKDIIGCYPPELAAHFDEWKLARDRMNEAVFVKLQKRGSTAKPFVVSTYHMPCLFGSAPKVRVMNIHIHLLLSRLRKFANGDPVVLMGDFNVKPHDSAYCLTASGGDLAAPAAWPEELEGLPERLPQGPIFPGGLTSAYCAFYGQEPLFTNYALNSVFNTEPFCETLDYIWYSGNDFKVVACPPLPQNREEVNGPFPSQTEPSDHLPLYATLKLDGK
eukprot:TRINITY_DN74789_c0_g1_i1.p1 TRINITY_DN74789_c0_g1~~TRINITY_DN74789_c0_g1_i1.p1  ORF type:complete len:437 (+),score=58.07 TRINITY_DN74789_c0_g1_i1:38-1348(+)